MNCFCLVFPLILKCNSRKSSSLKHTCVCPYTHKIKLKNPFRRFNKNWMRKLSVEHESFLRGGAKVVWQSNSLQFDPEGSAVSLNHLTVHISPVLSSFHLFCSLQFCFLILERFLFVWNLSMNPEWFLKGKTNILSICWVFGLFRGSFITTWTVVLSTYSL